MVLIPLSQGLFAMVDDEDAERVLPFKWYARREKRADGSERVYAVRNIAGSDGKKTIQWMHRYLMGVAPGEEVDHIDGNGANNMRCNLRVCTRAENSRNARPCAGKSSQYKGVSRDKRVGKWKSYIKVDGRMINLGDFSSELEAANAYDVADTALFGDFARTNAMEGLL